MMIADTRTTLTRPEPETARAPESGTAPSASTAPSPDQHASATGPKEAPGPKETDSRRQTVRLVLLGVLCTAGWLASVLVGHFVDCGPELHRIGLAVHILALVLSFGTILVVDWLGLLWLMGKVHMHESPKLEAAAKPLIWGGLALLLVSGALIQPDLGGSGGASVWEVRRRTRLPRRNPGSLWPSRPQRARPPPSRRRAARGRRFNRRRR